jgi:predicted RNA-binding protein
MNILKSRTKKINGGFAEKTGISLFIALLLLVSANAHASTTVTVDDNSPVTVNPPSALVQPVVTDTVVLNQTPVDITKVATTRDFEGRVVGVDYAQYIIHVLDPNQIERQVSVKQDVINNYRVGDTVLIHPTSDVTIVTLQDNPKDFEGEIFRVDIPKNEIMVQDTNGRERRVQMKTGMIATYKVDDYVRIHLMADLKEAKTIETIGDVRSLQGNIVSIDYSRSQIVVRNTHGKDTTVWARQGLINNYHIGENVRIYTLPNHEEAQLIRVVR